MTDSRLADYIAHMRQATADIAWRNMRGMRNRIAHGYFDIDLDVVWDTAKTAVPTLRTQLDSLRV